MTTPSAAHQNIPTTTTEEFEVLLVSDEREPGYAVFCPALPGCNSQGDDWNEALAMISEAIEGFLEVAPRPVVAEDAKSRLIAECIADGFRVDEATVLAAV